MRGLAETNPIHPELHQWFPPVVGRPNIGMILAPPIGPPNGQYITLPDGTAAEHGDPTWIAAQIGGGYFD
eukprot:5640873-Pyramimonas_sp.AAC.1